MLTPPRLGFIQRHLVDELAHVCIMDRNRQPLQSRRGLDAIPVAPIALGVLQVVVKDEQVDVVNEVKIAAPRYIVRLDDADSHERRDRSFSNLLRTEKRVLMPITSPAY